MDRDSESALGLSRRGFLKAASIAPVAAPMLAAGLPFALGGDPKGEFVLGLSPARWRSVPGVCTQQEIKFGEPITSNTFELVETTEQIGRALHGLPLRRIDGRYIGETVTVPKPITASEREERNALARSVLPYAAQVQWGIA